MAASMRNVIFSLFLIIFVYYAEGSQVFELSERFMQVKEEGMWLIKFYAPWCGHCKKLEPIWGQVAQELNGIVRVGRMDCTRYTNAANEFNIRGYPTILFLKGPKIYSYKGDRTKEEIVDFALRVSGPPVKTLKKFEEYEEQRKKFPVLFVYIGNENESDLLRQSYQSSAEYFHTTTSFYTASPSVFAGKPELKLSYSYPAVVVFKDGIHLAYTVPTNESVINETLFDWINQERFTLFPKITHGTFPHMMQTGKYVVMAVLEENKVGNISPDMMRFKEMLQSVLTKNVDIYKNYFQFGWTGHPDIANSVAMALLPVPSLLVVQAETFKYLMPEADPEILTPEIVEEFLDQVMNGSAKAYGGDSFFFKLYRMYFEGANALANMWKGNPVLTAVLFGLPMGFLSLICYSIWCSDILDAPDEEEEEMSRKHTKRE